MTSITVSPVQWSQLKNIDDITPLNEADSPCLMELKEVLRRHGKDDRFGVALLHSHFELREDEIMLEFTDEENRTLTSTVVDRANAPEGSVGTVWMLRDGPPATMAWCRAYCYKEPIFRIHSRSHNSVPGR